jgi:hypothetical protein
LVIDECISETDGLTCTVVNGQMRLYMPESEDPNYVFYQARTAIKSILDNPSFHDNVVGLLKSTYLGPAIVIPSSFTGGDSIKGNQPKGGTLGVTSLVLVAVGSAALIVFVGSVYYMRRDSSSSDRGIDGNATQAAGSSVNDYSFPFVSPQARSNSPFSEMVPNAYQFNENLSILSGGMSIHSGGMSILSGHVEGLEAVLEQSDEEAQSPRTAPSPAHTDTSSILVSEAGYTTDAASSEDDLDVSLSFDVPRSLYAKTTDSPDRLLMGARRRRESHVTANASLLDTSSESDGEMHDEPMLVWTPSKSAVFSEDDDDADYNDNLLNLV